MKGSQEPTLRCRHLPTSSGGEFSEDPRCGAEAARGRHSRARPHREVTDERDFADHITSVEVPVDDLRRVAAEESGPVGENTVRVLIGGLMMKRNGRVVLENSYGRHVR
jgi:hypothetical protein